MSDREFVEEDYQEEVQEAQNLGIDPLLAAALSPETQQENLINMDRQDKASSEYELSFDDVIEYLEHVLRGHIKDSKSGDWKTDKEKDYRLLNDRGIQDIKYALMAVGNRNVFLSNIPEDKVYYFIRTLRIDLAKLLAYNYQTYDAKKQYLSYILNLITAVIASAFFRSMDGGERKIRKENVIKRYMFGSVDRGDTAKRKDGGKGGILSYLGL